MHLRGKSQWFCVLQFQWLLHLHRKQPRVRVVTV
jgi:hypothetical protein